MKAGAKRCRAGSSCKRQATGALLIYAPFSGRPMFPTHGVYACQECLEEAMHRLLSDRTSLEDLILHRARKES